MTPLLVIGLVYVIFSRARPGSHLISALLTELDELLPRARGGEALARTHNATATLTDLIIKAEERGQSLGKTLATIKDAALAIAATYAERLRLNDILAARAVFLAIMAEGAALFLGQGLSLQTVLASPPPILLLALGIGAILAVALWQSGRPWWENREHWNDWLGAVFGAEVRPTADFYLGLNHLTELEWGDGNSRLTERQDLLKAWATAQNTADRARLRRAEDLLPLWEISLGILILVAAFLEPLLQLGTK